MKNTSSNLKQKLISKYLTKDFTVQNQKRTDINILLNRVKLNQKIENRKKLYFLFSSIAGLFVFGFLIF